MADACVEVCASATQLHQNGAVSVECKCAHCKDLERKLNDILEELSSTELILKRLQAKLPFDRSGNSRRTMQHHAECPSDVNTLDEPNGCTIATYNHQMMTSRGNNGDDSQMVKLI
jgi:hypothetical protein